MSYSIPDRLFSQVKSPSFAVTYWDGNKVNYGEGEPEFELRLNDRNVCESIFANVSLRFGEAFMSGAIDVEGDLRQLCRLLFAQAFEDFDFTLMEKARIGAMAFRQRNSIAQARKNIAHHYDLGNDFFDLWLGRERAYSCAYFKEPDDDIDTAQDQKFDHICSKLHLRRGETLLDIGCGWGGLVIHAARNYGARCLGITLSEEQMAGARERVRSLKLEDQIEIRVQDYRELPPGRQFDRITSIGMLEHVGQENHSRYFERTASLLAPGGIGVVQSIGRMVAQQTNPWISKYIFPGMYLPSLSEIAAPMGEQGLDIVDVEVWRRHYALTLDRWSEAFETHVEEIRDMYDEAFVRMWRLYLSSCSTGFRHGNLTLWQVQFTSGLNNDLPLTREYLYQENGRPALRGVA